MGLFKRIAEAVEYKVIVPGLPEGRQALVEDHDEPVIAEPERDSRSGLSYFITYAGGSLSQRRVTIRKIDLDAGAIKSVLAFCHERGAPRQFRIDRIEEAIDIETGEIFGQADLCAALLDRGIPVAERRLAAMIRILVFMARCDGHAHLLEWDAIDRAVVRLSRCLIDDDRGLEDLLADARRLTPDGADFIRALKSLSKTRMPARMHAELRRAIGDVISADGFQHDQELYWGIEAMDLIAQMPVSE